MNKRQDFYDSLYKLGWVGIWLLPVLFFQCLAGANAPRRPMTESAMDAAQAHNGCVVLMIICATLFILSLVAIQPVRRQLIAEKKEREALAMQKQSTRPSITITPQMQGLINKAGERAVRGAVRSIVKRTINSILIAFVPGYKGHHRH